MPLVCSPSLTERSVADRSACPRPCAEKTPKAGNRKNIMIDLVQEIPFQRRGRCPIHTTQRRSLLVRWFGTSLSTETVVLALLIVTETAEPLERCWLCCRIMAGSHHPGNICSLISPLFLLATLLVPLCVSPTTAFGFPFSRRQNLTTRKMSFCAPTAPCSPQNVPTVVHMSTDEETSETKESSSSSSALVDKLPFEEGSHEELVYALGVNLARELGDIRPLLKTGEELASATKGIVDALVGQLTEEGQQQLLNRRGQELKQLITERAMAIQQRLTQAGQEMLAQMTQTDGAQALPSGVVLHVLEDGPEGKGQGARPTQASTVKIHFHGTMADGTIFDSTLAKGEPVSLPVAGVLPGLREGLLHMHQGETAMIGIPPALAYGDKGTPDGRIPPGSTLFFKVQLVEILTASIGGSPTLLGADGQKLEKGGSQGGGLLGADGKPLA
jgi:FKBP-type peptidyl-prolyl cis-trans isomerase